RLVLSQAVEAGLQRGVRLVLRANPLDQRRDQALAPDHESLEVLCLAEAPAGFLVALLGLGEPVLEPRDDLAPLVRDLAEVIRALLLVAKLLLEPRDLLACRLELRGERFACALALVELRCVRLPCLLELRSEPLALLDGRRKLRLDALELRGKLRDPRFPLAERLAKPV